MSLRNHVIAVVIALPAFVLTGASAARADECQRVCAGAKSTCSQAAAQAKRVCYAACDDASTAADCRRACKVTHRVAKRVCGEERSECRDACHEPLPPPSPCTDACLADAKQCFDDVHTGGKVCMRGCKQRAYDAREACHDTYPPGRCLGPVGRDLGACLHGCAADVSGGIRDCRQNLESCFEGCTGYGSPGHAFLIPSTSLFD